MEHKGYAEAQNADRREGKGHDGSSDLLETVLDRDNLNRVYKQVKRNHSAAGIDGMTVEEALPWLIQIFAQFQFEVFHIPASLHGYTYILFPWFLQPFS